jgi:outer membrane protein
MLEQDNTRKHRSALVRVSFVTIAIMILIVGTAAAQDSPLPAPQSALGTAAIPLGRLGGVLSLATTVSVEKREWSASAPPVPVGELAVTAAFIGRNPIHPDGVQRITLEQVKQQALANPSTGPLAHLGQLSIEAAKQHRLGVQADYFPKIGATVANLHYSEFLGQVLSIQRPVAGSMVQVPVPLLAQNQTIVAVTFVQPITPLFQVYQLVKIARADERIAMAKAGVPVAGNGSAARTNASSTQIEETYFKLLIARRKLTSAELKLRSTEPSPLYASTSIEPARTPSQEPELVEAKKELMTTGVEVKELTASLNGVMGWPVDTALELVPPDPLIENISLQEIADKSASANHPELIEAQQTVVKARAAATLSKLAYMPTVAAVAGFMYQNAIPLLPNTFGYGGVMISYNLFDSGKRERAVKEATAQSEMAELGVELTKAKLAANVKASYFELQRSRQLGEMAQQMGSSVTRLMKVSSTAESIEVKAARTKVETEMFEADLAHRQAFARLKSLLGPQ